LRSSAGVADIPIRKVIYSTLLRNSKRQLESSPSVAAQLIACVCISCTIVNTPFGDMVVTKLRVLAYDNQVLINMLQEGTVLLFTTKQLVIKKKMLHT